MLTSSGILTNGLTRGIWLIDALLQILPNIFFCLTTKSLDPLSSEVKLLLEKIQSVSTNQ